MAEQPTMVDKVIVALRSAWWFAVVLVRVRRTPLPQVVRQLARVAAPRPARVGPVRTGRLVSRTLKIGPYRARCLYTSLVLFRLLREYGEEPEIVIGLPQEASDKDAHAWIELDGKDVGPPPGRGTHTEFARYGR
jgi:hypothetical protein